jgi:hypothetical protein
MKYQPVYETENLDFDATYQKLSDPLLRSKYAARLNRAGRNPDTEGSVDAGSLQFTLYPTQIKILVSPKGPRHRLQTFSWVNIEEKETYLPMLQSLLVPMPGQTIVQLHPLSMNIAGNILYPGPKNLELPWCAFKVTYSRVISGFAGWLFGDWSERRAERKARECQEQEKELRARLEMDREELEMIEDDPDLQKKVSEMERRVRREHGLDP